MSHAAPPIVAAMFRELHWEGHWLSDVLIDDIKVESDTAFFVLDLIDWRTTIRHLEGGVTAMAGFPLWRPPLSTQPLGRTDRVVA